VSLFVVEHEPDVVADTPSAAGDTRLLDLEAQAGSFESQAAELRKRAERLSEKAHHLRAMVRWLRGELSADASGSNDCARLRRPTGVRGRSLVDLTPRQREIASLVASGRTNRQIAQELVLTTGTVANHVAQILDRLGLDNRVQLAAWAIERGEVQRDRIVAI